MIALAQNVTHDTLMYYIDVYCKWNKEAEESEMIF